MFEALYARGEVAACFRDDAWVQAMCDVEAALARALATRGEIPVQSAEQITANLADTGGLDVAELRRSVAENATPVVGLVAALRDRLGPDTGAHVHAGATSQDIVDTALMLLLRRAVEIVLADLDAAADAAARLADAHRATPMIARTLMQQALPTTLGAHVAGWLDGLDEARIHLLHVRDAELAVQMGGPVGGRDPGLSDAVAAELGLAAPVTGWATIRVRPALTASVLGVLAGVCAKIARDVTLLAQTEIGELSEGSAGGSSAMAHKRNPVAAVSTLACAKRTPGLVATMLAAMESEYARAAGAWQAEWGTLTELATLTGSAIAWLRELLEGLEVDADRMTANLTASPTGDRSLPDGVDALVDRALGAHGAGRDA